MFSNTGLRRPGFGMKSQNVSILEMEEPSQGSALFIADPGVVKDAPAPCGMSHRMDVPQSEAPSAFACFSPCVSVWVPSPDWPRTKQQPTVGFPATRGVADCLPPGLPVETRVRFSPHPIRGREPLPRPRCPQGEVFPRTSCRGHSLRVKAGSPRLSYRRECDGPP